MMRNFLSEIHVARVRKFMRKILLAQKIQPVRTLTDLLLFT